MAATGAMGLGEGAGPSPRPPLRRKPPQPRAAPGRPLSPWPTVSKALSLPASVFSSAKWDQVGREEHTHLSLGCFRQHLSKNLGASLNTYTVSICTPPPVLGYLAMHLNIFLVY